MSEYAQLLTSFERTGKYPLEANYIFETEDELREFFLADPLRTAILHEGLMKIVKDDGLGHQALYWVVMDENGDPDFKKLFTADSEQELGEMIDALNELSSQLQTMQEALSALGVATLSGDDSLKNQIKAIVGCGDDDNVLEFLSGLSFGSLKEISEWIENVDFESVWNKIEGDPLPSEKLQTLRGIEDYINEAISANAYAHRNMIGEIDKIETAVGLNADGSFSPDPTTNYLTEATSVQHALRILDNLIKEQGSSGSVLTNAYYDSANERLVMVFTLENGDPDTVYIPLGDLIEEWKVSNSEESCVKLYKERVEGGGPDLLSAGIEWEEYDDGEDDDG